MTGTRRLIIHIGGGKTGTTTIQRSFAAARAHLLQEGILYPGAAGGAEGIGHDGFGKSFIDVLPFYMKPPKDPEGDRQAIAAEIRESQAPVILISTEQFETANPQRVRAFFDGLGERFDYRIVYAVRSQDELAESEYNQLVKLGRYRDSFERYAAEHFFGDFHARATAWAAVFGQDAVACRVFDGRRQNAVPMVLGAAGLDPALLNGIALPSSTNRALGHRALAAIRLIHLLEHSERKLLVQHLLAGEGKDMPALFMDAAEASAFRARYAASNEALGEAFLGGAISDLGGRRYADDERDAIRAMILADRLGD